MCCEHPELNNSSGSDEKTKQFLRLLMTDHNRIYAFILTLIPHTSDADDLMQDTTALMWKKFEQFKIGTDFVSWGIKIAHNLIKDFRRRRATSKVQYNDEVFNILLTDAVIIQKEINKKVVVLQHCMSMLPKDQHRLLIDRYEKGLSIKEMAESLGKPAYSVYRTLGKIYDILLRCVRRNIVVEG